MQRSKKKEIDLVFSGLSPDVLRKLANDTTGITFDFGFNDPSEPTRSGDVSAPAPAPTPDVQLSSKCISRAPYIIMFIVCTLSAQNFEYAY